MHSILIVFRHEETRTMVTDALAGDYAVTAADTGEAALEHLRSGDFELVVADDTLSDMTGEELATRTRAAMPEVRVVIASKRESVDSAIDLLGVGRFVYVEKPLSAARVRNAVAIERERASLHVENLALRARAGDIDAEGGVLIGTSMAIEHVRGRVKFVADSSAPVLITGESGTGKRVAAEAVHRASPRAHAPLVTVDCGATPDHMIERDLFGFQRNGAHGAPTRERGKIERARGGTLVLIEVGDIPTVLQTMLLHSLREAENDVRVIATTRHDLRARVGTGEFREDLFYTLNVLAVEMPTLCERRADIPALALYFMKHSAARNRARPVQFTPEAMERLSNSAWRGNVRELQNVVERCVLLGAGGTVDTDDLQMDEGAGGSSEMARLEHVFRTGSIREMEKLMILNRLKEKNDNRTRSAESLEISVRTLRNKLNEYNVRRSAPNRQDRESIVV